MHRDEYLALLTQLARSTIWSPSFAQVKAFCPHLNADEIAEIFKTVEGGESFYFAAPPVRVNNAHQILSLSPPFIGSDKKDYAVHLSWVYTNRTPASYADGRLKGDIDTTYRFADKAIAYAQEHWGGDLILDSWNRAGFNQFLLQDPKDQTKRGDPKTKMVVYVCLNRDWNEIINDPDAPESVVIDNHIVELTTSGIIGDELKGGRGGFTEFNCSRCGDGLSCSGCSSCGLVFKDDHFRCGWDTPLPRKIVEFAQRNGLVFTTDPSIAQKREADRWGENQRKHA